MREEQWKERKKGRTAHEKTPDDPKVLIRMVPVTVSCSTLLKRFKNSLLCKGLHNIEYVKSCIM